MALKKIISEKEIGLFLETAHPAKFSEVVEPLIKKPVALPESLKKFENRVVNSQRVSNDYEQFKKKLISDYQAAAKKDLIG